MNVADPRANQNPQPASEPAQPSRSRAIASSIVWCLFIAAGTDVLVAIMVQANVWWGDGFPWFVAPALALSLAVFRRSRRWYEPLPSVRPPSLPIAVLASILVAIAIAAVAYLSITLVAHEAFTHGRIALPGDAYQTTAAVRAGVSLTTPVMASFYEESGTRGALQLRLQHVIGPLWAEILAATVFVILHVFVIAKSPWIIPFLVFSAFANGRLAAITQTVGYPVLSHALSNGILTVIYASLRGMNR